MLISAQYPAFNPSTLFIITNHAIARPFVANDREFIELPTITTTPEEKLAVHALVAPFDQTDLDLPELIALAALCQKLAQLIPQIQSHQACTNIAVALPNINRNLFFALIPEEFKLTINNTITKNLASMEAAHILRIIGEGKLN